MEKLSAHIAEKIGTELNLTNDDKEVIAYGTFAVLHMALSIMLVAIFGLLFHVVLEALIISFSASILRKYSGGVHASTPRTCATFGTIICVGQALLLSRVIGPLINLNMMLTAGAIIFTWSIYIVYKLAPVDSPSKPIKKKEKKIRMKKGSIIVLSVYLVVVAILVSLSIYTGKASLMTYSLCIYGGVIWQVFTLTKPGHSVLEKIDNLFNQIFIFTGRKV